MPPINAHGASMAIELDPVGAPDVFTTVPYYTGEAGENFTSDTKRAFPHDRNVPVTVPGALNLNGWPINGLYDYGNAAHEALRQYAISRETFKARHRGAGGLASTDEIIASGFMESFTVTNPEDDFRRFESMFMPDGDTYLVDGVSIV